MSTVRLIPNDAVRVEPMRCALTFRLGRAEWLTSNSRVNRFKRAEIVRGLRWRAALQGKAQRAAEPFSTERPCRVVVTVAIPDGRRFDPPNSAPTVKALVDGLTEAGWWTDDNSDVIVSFTYKRGEPTGVNGLYTVMIEASEEGVFGENSDD